MTMGDYLDGYEFVVVVVIQWLVLVVFVVIVGILAVLMEKF